MSGKIAQGEYIIEFAIGEQTCIGGDNGSTKLNHNATVEIEVQNLSSSLHPSGSSLLARQDRRSYANYKANRVEVLSAVPSLAASHGQQCIAPKRDRHDQVLRRLHVT